MANADELGDSMSHNDGADLEDDYVDDAAHEKLLNSLFALDGKKRNKNNVRGISTQSGSLDLVVHAKKDESKIKPQDLKLKARDVTGNLKKSMSGLETEQIKRQITRETIKTEMNTWEPVVQEIRAAPQLIFSKRPHGIEMRNAMKPSGFTPRTPLEKELFAALGQSEDVLHPNKELTKAEERALKAMSVKEAMARRAELMKHHELLSRAQVRAKRVKKIKSKRYRKVVRKEKESAERKELERLQQTDPEAFVERLEQLEKDRMEERLTLKHRGGGKFARLHKVYSKFDDKTREAMQDMLQKSRELTKKTATVSSSEDEDEQAEVGQEKDSGIVIDDDEKDDKRETEKPSLKTSRLEMLKAINKKAGGWLDGPKSTFVYVDSQAKTSPDTPQASSDQQEGVSGEPVATVAETEALSPLREEESTTTQGPDGTEKKPTSADTETSTAKGAEKKRKQESLQAENGEEDAGGSVPKKKRRKRNRKKGTQDDGQEENAANVKKTPVVEVTLKTPADDVNDEDRLEEDEDESLKVTMEELFQDEDVMEEFAREKAAAEEKARPKIEDTRLPGWGSWAGPDYKKEKPLTKKQKRAEERARQLEKQQQKVKQPHVWLNPNRDDAIRKLQPKAVPFPYTSVQQYEASLRQPVSRGFVRETAFKLLTKPEVVTKLGHIITPLDKEDMFKKKSGSEDVDVKNGAFAGKGKSQAGGSRPNNKQKAKSVFKQSHSSHKPSKVIKPKDKQKRKGI